MQHDLLSEDALDVVELLYRRQREGGHPLTARQLRSELGKFDRVGFRYIYQLVGLNAAGYASVVDCDGGQGYLLEDPEGARRDLTRCGRLDAPFDHSPRERPSALSERGIL
jgi:hypothetical protein